MTNLGDSGGSRKLFGGAGRSSDSAAQSPMGGAYEYPPLESVPESLSQSLPRPASEPELESEPESPQPPDLQQPSQQQLHAQGGYYAPQPQPPYPPVGYYGYQPPVQYRPQGNLNKQDPHWLAIPGLAASLLGLTPAVTSFLGLPRFYSVGSLVLGAAGVIFGVVAVTRIKRTGREGRGIALSAIALGLVTLATCVVFFVLGAVGVLG